MLASITESALPSCIGFLIPTFSHLHRGTVSLRVPENLQSLRNTCKYTQFKTNSTIGIKFDCIIHY